MVRPWEVGGWDEYVSAHDDSTVYHTSTWCRIVSDIGDYPSLCLIHKSNDRIDGVLPIMEVRSWLLGNRMVALPFSDESPPLADNAEAARALVGRAFALQEERGLGFFELRGGAVSAGLEDPAATQNHFTTYTIPLTRDTEAVFKSFARKAVRQTIKKSERLGVSVRRGEGESDLDVFYRLYALNRKNHGIPPQPRRLFSSIFEGMTGEPEAVLYLAEHDGRPAAGLVVLRFKGVAYAKYEGVDAAFQRVLPIHGLFWKAIEDTALAGDHTFDLGRTAADNTGLNAFKSRWGTQTRPIPYLFHPPSEGVSVVKSDSLKYILFTSLFKRMPMSLSVRVGERIFRHFG